MRVQIAPQQYRSPLAGITLVFSGFALLGTSLVLLLKSPFRMPPGERIFRLLWLGPIGRAFVRASMRGVAPRDAGRRVAVAAPARAQATPAPRVEQLRPTLLPGAKAKADAADPLGALEARVAELERWRRSAEE
jgi:hypothetical protein